MDITIGSYKIKLEIVLLFIVLFWIMFGHVLCSCCNIGLKDGFELMTGMEVGGDSKMSKSSSSGASAGGMSEEEKNKVLQKMALTTMADPNTSDEDKQKIKKIMAISAMKQKSASSSSEEEEVPIEEDTTIEDSTEETDVTTSTSSRTKPTKEGFVGSNNSAEGPEFASSNSPGYIRNPDKWTSVVNYNYNQNNGITPGELDIFAKMDFKPECCPNTYSSSMGCACMSSNTYDMLANRGGNNVPYSEY